MPANLTQQYKKAEEEYRRAATPEEELACLQKMLQEIPKHKGTDHLQAELKTKISKVKKEMTAEKSSSKKTKGLRIPRQGAGVAVIIGGPNAGKSQLTASLTNAHREIAPYPFTTTVPAPAMMPWEDVTVQLIDTPPITADFMDPALFGLIRAADLALLMVDLENDDGVEQCQAVLDRLSHTKTRLAAESYLDEADVGLSYTKTFLVPNKIDAPGASDRLNLLHELLPLDFTEFVISALHGTNLENFAMPFTRRWTSSASIPNSPPPKSPTTTAPSPSNAAEPCWKWRAWSTRIFSTISNSPACGAPPFTTALKSKAITF